MIKRYPGALPISSDRYLLDASYVACASTCIYKGRIDQALYAKSLTTLYLGFFFGRHTPLNVG